MKKIDIKKLIGDKYIKLDNDLNKCYQKYNDSCNKMTNFLIKYIISDYDEEQYHTFYVDYSSESDGLVLHIDLGVGMSNYICGIHSIIKLFIQQNKKLTIEQIIDETSF